MTANCIISALSEFTRVELEQNKVHKYGRGIFDA